MNKEKNTAVLDALKEDLSDDCGEYTYIPEVVAKTNFMMFEEMKVDRNSLNITKYGTVIVSICWSYNEPKVYFTSGLLTFRILADEESLVAAFAALEKARRLFCKELAPHEM